jgi:hypothetical protein
MKLVMTLSAGDDAELIEAHLSYHLAAGVDLVLVAQSAQSADVGEVLESYSRSGAVRVVPADSAEADFVQRTSMARMAAVEHAADWVIDSDRHEFWWPRAESLKDALQAIPPRYTVVQALVRKFEPSDSGGPRTVRSAFDGPVRGPLALDDWLRPVYRASPELVLLPRGKVAEPWRVPLRAWYPIEVFDLTSETTTPAAGMSSSYVSDSRLVDGIARLRSTGSLSISVPDIVDDAAYAVECAALGEADFEPIETHIADLEARIAVLEARFWPSIRRALRRLARHPS